MLILTISVCTLIVAFGGYRLQRNANEPELASAGPTITMWPDKPKEPKVVVLDFINIGKKPGRLGTATLFGLNEDHTHPRKLDEVPIVGTMVPGWNVRAKLTFNSELPALFLACVIYYDLDNSPLTQAFLYRLPSNTAQLNELETPDYGKVCN